MFNRGLVRLRNVVLRIIYTSFVRLWDIGETNVISTHLTAAEKMQLYLLARAKRSTAVEIGSYLGASACVIGSALSGLRRETKLFCVDTWQNDAMSEGGRDTYAEFLYNTRRYAKLIQPLRGDSVAMASTFSGKVDFLFVDGDHSYEGVAADVQAWFPKLNRGAVVAFHDIGWAEGVQRVVAEHVKPLARKEGRLPNLYWAYL